METLNRVIVSLVYFNSLVRDTLEYTMPRNSYDPRFYEYKRNGIINEVKVNSPLKVFIEQNGEKGQALLEEIQKFGEDFYSDTSTVITRVLATKRVIDGKEVEVPESIRVDHAQNLRIFEAVMPLHESLNNVIKVHEEFAEQHDPHNADSVSSDGAKTERQRVKDLLKADERFYRAVALMTLITETNKQFGEFNKAMREAGGQPSPQSNFIQEELNKLVGLINMMKANATCTDEIYTNALDSIFKYVEMMTGKRDLPKGKNFQDVFNEIGIETQVFVEDSEKQWNQTYGPLLAELVNDNKLSQQAVKDVKENKEEVK